MFEKEIQFITDFNLNKIKKLGSFFSLDDLTKAKVHPAIVQYISAEIDYLIFLDRQNLLQKSVFDYSGSEIVEHFLAISQEIKKNKLLPYEEVKKIIQQAVTFQLTYLLRPVWTLKKFIFDSSEIRSQEEVKLFLNYLYFFDYYKKIFLTILEKKKLLTISIYEFESLLEKIQRQLLEQQMKNVIENALMDAAEFINTGEVTKTKLAIETLEIFLKDKGLHNHIFKIRKLLSVDPKQKFELSEIYSALFSPISIEDEGTSTFGEPPVENPKDESQLNIFESVVESLHQDENLADELLRNTSEPVAEEEETEDSFDRETKLSDTPELPIENYAEQNLSDHEVDTEEEISGTAGEESLIENNIGDEYNPESKINLYDEVEFPAGNEIMREEELTQDELGNGNEEFIEEDTFLSDAQSGENDLEETDELEPVVENFSTGPVETELESGEISFEKYFKEELEKAETKLEEDPFLEAEIEQQSQPLFEETTKVEEESSEENELDIFSYFTTKETMKIISAIFNQDSLDYVNTLERIAECKQEDEADQILKDVFLSYRVNSVGKEATLLKEKVEQFFRDKEF